MRPAPKAGRYTERCGYRERAGENTIFWTSPGRCKVRIAQESNAMRIDKQSSVLLQSDQSVSILRANRTSQPARAQWEPVPRMVAAQALQNPDRVALVM